MQFNEVSIYTDKSFKYEGVVDVYNTENGKYLRMTNATKKQMDWFSDNVNFTYFYERDFGGNERMYFRDPNRGVLIYYSQKKIEIPIDNVGTPL